MYNTNSLKTSIGTAKETDNNIKFNVKDTIQ